MIRAQEQPSDAELIAQLIQALEQPYSYLRIDGLSLSQCFGKREKEIVLERLQVEPAVAVAVEEGDVIARLKARITAFDEASMRYEHSFYSKRDAALDTEVIELLKLPEGSGDGKMREALVALNARLDAFWVNRSNKNMQAVCDAQQDCLKVLTPAPTPSQKHNLGSWMSAALDDPNVCEEMKADIRHWFSLGEPAPSSIDAAGMREACARAIEETIEEEFGIALKLSEQARSIVQNTNRMKAALANMLRTLPTPSVRKTGSDGKA